MMANSLISDFVQENNEKELDIQSVYYKELVHTKNDGVLKILSESILLKYQADLNEIVETVTLTPEEAKKYHYNPHLLSYDLYGTPDYWFLLLDLNGLSSFTEFDINPIKVYNSNLEMVIASILNQEKESINLNAEEIKV